MTGVPYIWFIKVSDINTSGCAAEELSIQSNLIPKNVNLVDFWRGDLFINVHPAPHVVPGRTELLRLTHQRRICAATRIQSAVTVERGHCYITCVPRVHLEMDHALNYDVPCPCWIGDEFSIRVARRDWPIPFMAACCPAAATELSVTSTFLPNSSNYVQWV